VTIAAFCHAKLKYRRESGKGGGEILRCPRQKADFRQSAGGDKNISIISDMECIAGM
jgi:hypothetical protein